MEGTPGRATLSSWVVGPLHSYTQEGWVDNNNSPPSVLCNLSLRTVVKLCTLGVLTLGVSLVFLNCDDVCMCVVNKQFELLEFVFESVYVDLQYDEISLTFTAGSVCLCGGCSPVVVLGLSVRLSWYPML